MKSLFCCHWVVLVDNHSTLKIWKLKINHWTKSLSGIQGCCKHIGAIRCPEKSLACSGNTIKSCDIMECTQLNCWSISAPQDIQHRWVKIFFFITRSMKPAFRSLFISQLWHLLILVVLTFALGVTLFPWGGGGRSISSLPYRCSCLFIDKAFICSEGVVPRILQDCSVLKNCAV